MTVNRLQRTVLWLFVAVVADSMVAAVLRVGSIQAFLDGERSWQNLIALGGLGCLALLLTVTAFTIRELLDLWHQLTGAQGRVAVLEASAMMSRAQAQLPSSPGRTEITRDVVLARQRVTDLLERGNLSVAMQPIVDLARDRWVAAEALARFPDGRGPDVWFGEAQEMGLAVELDLLAFSAALSRAPELPPHIGLSINASPSLILDRRLARTIYDSGIELDRLTLEITEHAAVTEYDEINTALLQLRERGVHVAVDDTGAGFASLRHVLRLRPDVIKLDRSMVVNIADDAAKRAFVTAVILLALVVETLGVDHAQGYFLARPDTSAAVWQSWVERRWVSPVRHAPLLLHLDA